MGLNPSYAATATVVAAALAGALWGPQARVDMPGPMMPGLALGCLVMGVFTITQRPRALLAQLLFGTGLLALTWVAAWTWSGFDSAAWLVQWAWWPPLVLLTVLLVLFPDSPGRGRRVLLARGVAVSGALGTVSLAASAAFAPRSLVTSASAVPTEGRPWLAVALAALLLTVIGAGAALTSLVARARRAPPDRRAAFACLVPGAAMVPVGVVLDTAGVPFAMPVALLAVPVGIGVAVVEAHWSDLDVTVNRGWVSRGWNLLIWLVVLAVVVASAALLEGMKAPLLAVTVAAVVLAGEPLRRRASRAADRWLHGHRDDPLGLLRSLGQRMESAPDPRAVLDEVVAAVPASLKVPYAALALDLGEGTLEVVADHGRLLVHPIVFSLQSGQNTLGELRVSPRRAGEPFTAAELSVLEQIARQSAFVAQSYALTIELQRARQHLVTSREEERRRLRNDLHDGLGPTLAGARLQLAAVAARTPELDSRSRERLRIIAEDLTGASQSVRELIEGLRPAALDAGLSTALAETLPSLVPHLVVTVDTQAFRPPGGLPAAVEVAAYRIASEAVLNAGKHAATATTVTIRLILSPEQLTLVVADDGLGGAVPSLQGVGMRSLATRAGELGGTLEVHSDRRGTVITAELPLPEGG